MTFLVFVVFLITLAWNNPWIGYDINQLAVYYLLAAFSFRLGIMVSTIISGEYYVIVNRIKNNQKYIYKFRWLNKTSASLYGMTVILMLAASLAALYSDEYMLTAVLVCYLVSKNLIFTRLYGKNFDFDPTSKGLYDTMYPDKEDSSSP